MDRPAGWKADPENEISSDSTDEGTLVFLESRKDHYSPHSIEPALTSKLEYVLFVCSWSENFFFYTYISEVVQTMLQN